MNLRLIDAETINRAAQQAGVPQRALAELEHEGDQSLASRVLKALRTMPALSPGGEVSPAQAEAPSLTLPFVGLFSPTVSPLSASLGALCARGRVGGPGVGQEGNVLVVGRGSQVLLRKHPGALACADRGAHARPGQNCHGPLQARQEGRREPGAGQRPGPRRLPAPLSRCRTGWIPLCITWSSTPAAYRWQRRSI